MPSYILELNGTATPLPRGNSLDTAKLWLQDPLSASKMPFEDFLQRRISSDAMLIAKDGKVVYENYFNGMRESDRHLIHSCTKTLTTMRVGLAITEGHLDPTRLVSDFLSELAGIKVWQNVTVQHVLDMSTGIATDEHYENPESMYFENANAVGYWGKTDARFSGAYDFVLGRLTEPDCEPGAKFNYASYNTNLLPLILEKIYGEPAAALYERDLFQKIGAEHEAILNADACGAPIVEGHLNLLLRDFYRWGYLLHSGGLNLAGQQVLPTSWVAQCLASDTGRRQAFLASDYAEVFTTAEYHNQLWVLDPAQEISVMLGIYGQFFYSDRSRDIVIVGLSSYAEMAPPLMVASMLELWSGVTEVLASNH